MKRTENFQKGLFLCLLVVLLFLNGCTIRQLDKAKDAAAKGDYAAVAALKADCDASDEGCNQLHLIKGDACYRLAKQGTDALKNYTCAATELSAGINMTRQWQMESYNLNRPQTYENLCESLRNRRDLLKGAEADAANDSLLAGAQQFLQTEPGNACAVYFLNNALYAKTLPCLLHPERCPGICSSLKAIASQLNTAGTSSGDTHCGPNIRELKKEISSAGTMMNCR